MWDFLIWVLPIIAIVSFGLGYYFQHWWQKWRSMRQINTTYLDVQDDKLQNIHNQEVVDKLLGAVDQIITHNMALEPSQLIDRMLLQTELEKVKSEYLAQQRANSRNPSQDFTAPPSPASAEQGVAGTKVLNPQDLALTTPIAIHVNEPQEVQLREVPRINIQPMTHGATAAPSSVIVDSQATHVEHGNEDFVATPAQLATQALELVLDPQSTHEQLTELEQQIATLGPQESPASTTPIYLKNQARQYNTSTSDSATSKSAAEFHNAQGGQQPLVVRSSQDFAYQYAVLPADVAHLLELELVAALIWRQRGDFIKAINIYRHVLAVPTWKGVGHQRAQLDLARCYLQAGMFHKVVELLTPLLESEIYASQAMQLLLYYHQVSHNWKEGLALAKRNYAKFKTKPNLHILYHFYHQRLLECYHEIGHRRTMYAFQRLLELHNPHVRTLWMRGNYHFVHEDYASALADYKALVTQRIELLPDLIGNIACCFAMMREIGNNLGLFLRELLRRYPQVDYVLVIYDLYLQQYDFTQHAFGFEFAGKAKNLHELFHKLHSQMTQQLFASESQEHEDLAQLELATLEPTSTSKLNLGELGNVNSSGTVDTSSESHAQLHRQLYAKPKILDKFVDLIAREAKFRYDVVIYARLQRLLNWQQQHYSPLVAQQINALFAKMLEQMPAEQIHSLLQHQVMGDGQLKLRSSLQHNHKQQFEVQQSTQQLLKYMQQQQALEFEVEYACRNCGYTQRHVFWYCQACQKWETVYLKETQLRYKP